MKKRPVWQKFYICCLICILVTVSIVSTLYIGYALLEKKRVINGNIDNIKYFADNKIKDELDGVRSLVGSMTVAKGLKASIANDDAGSGSTQQFISTFYADNSNIASIFFVDTNGRYYSIGESIGGLEERIGIIEKAKKSQSFLENNYVWFYGKSDRGDDLCNLYQKIILLNDEFKKEYLGEILVCVDVAKITDNCFTGITDTTGIVFLDEYGVIVASSVAEMIGKMYGETFSGERGNIVYSSGKRYFYKLDESLVKSWKCVCFSEYSLFLDKTNDVLGFVILTAVVCCIIMGFVSYKIAYGIGKPIGELLKQVRVSDEGELVFEDERGTDEILALKNVFDDMSKKLVAETETRFIKEEQLKTAQLKALEEQVNPHFLYNTLQIIQMLSVTGKNNEVGNVVTCLGKMMRYNLDSRNEVYLGEEIENIENYFKILKYRYASDFVYKIYIDEKLRKIKSIKFLLQPFVENSFKHGFKEKTGLWEIVIMAVEYNNEVAVIIRDNGTGIEAEKLKSLKAMLASGVEGVFGNIGIVNVNKRIKLYYGARYGVDVFCEKNSTQIIIQIPKISDTESEDVYNV